MAKHELADVYRAERGELLDLGRSLTDAQAAQLTTACPAWSIKDIYAHLAGISTDILAGNTKDAATEPWADGHVDDRQQRSLAEVLDEWTTAGEGVSQIMDEAGEFFPLQLFIDQWTHGWDIRATLGQSAAQTPDLTPFEFYLVDLFQNMSGRQPKDLAPLTLHVAGESVVLGAHDAAPTVGTLELSLFDFARICMGRRSHSQLTELAWPDGLQDNGPYIDQLVFWSVNENDVHDPVLA